MEKDRTWLSKLLNSLPATQRDHAIQEINQRISQAEQTFKFHRLVLFVSHGADSLKVLARLGTLVLIFYFGYLSITALAGRTTLADVAIKWAVNVRFSEWVAWAAASFSSAAWAFTWRSKKRLEKNNLPRLAETEKELDPARTSSAPRKSKLEDE